jgi:hypothetical protein
VIAADAARVVVTVAIRLAVATGALALVGLDGAVDMLPTVGTLVGVAPPQAIRNVKNPMETRLTHRPRR